MIHTVRITSKNKQDSKGQDLLDSEIDIHYISNITGHGLRKIMRARSNFTTLDLRSC